MLPCILVYFSMLPISPLSPNHETLLGYSQLFTLGASIFQVSSLIEHNNLVNQTKSTEVLFPVNLEALDTYINISKVHICV